MSAPEPVGLRVQEEVLPLQVFPQIPLEPQVETPEEALEEGQNLPRRKVTGGGEMHWTLPPRGICPLYHRELS